MQSDILTQVILPISLFIIMLGMGLSLRISDFTDVFKSPKAMLIGLSCQLALLPVLGILVIHLVGLEGGLAVGLLIVALCPGGTTSNMMSYLSRGDVALSISLTAFVSLITPFTIPIFTAIALDYYLGDTNTFNLPIFKTIIQLIVITLIPVAIGILIHHLKPNLATKANKPVKIVSIAFLFLIIAGVVLKNKDSMANFFIDTGVATLLLNVIAIISGFTIAKMNKLNHPQSITLGLEIGIQNGTVALLISGTILGNAIMTIPAVTYSLLMFATGGLFGWFTNLQKSK